MRGGEPDEGALPVALVDLPERFAGPPATDRSYHVVDAAQPALHFAGEPAGSGERRVVVHHQVQPIAGRVAEHVPELVGPFPGAGRDHDIRAGGEVSADDTFADGACATGHDNAVTGQIGMRTAVLHETTPP